MNTNTDPRTEIALESICDATLEDLTDLWNFATNRTAPNSEAVHNVVLNIARKMKSTIGYLDFDASDKDIRTAIHLAVAIVIDDMVAEFVSMDVLSVELGVSHYRISSKENLRTAMCEFACRLAGAKPPSAFQA